MQPVEIRHAIAMIAAMMLSAMTAGAEVVLEKPFGMCLNDDGNLYIAEIDNNCIAVLDDEFQLKRRITEIEGYGPLSRPFDIRFHEGRFYVLDTGHSNVIVADRRWRLIRKIGRDNPGSAPGAFSEPHAIALTAEGRLFVTDTLNHRLQRFDAQGRFETSIDSTLLGGSFPITSPTGIDVLPNGRLVVAHYGDHPPVIIDIDGNVVRELESYGAAYCVSSRRDRIAVAYTYNNTVGVYSVTGEPLSQIGNALDSDQPGEFNKPAGVLWDHDGNLIVSEWRNKRLQKFSPEGRLIGVYGGSHDTDAIHGLVKHPRPKPDSPVVLSAFTRVLEPAAIRKYHDSGVQKLYLQPGEDLFNPSVKSAVDAGHALGMKMIVVFDTFFYGARELESRGTPGGVSTFALEHPDYFTLKRDGRQRNRRVLSYAYPEVRRFKVDAVVRALQKSGADGVALDYIRWPAGNTDGYDPPIVAAFAETYGENAFEVAPTDPRWAKTRARFITMFISELRDALARLDREVEVSVFVDDDPESERIAVGRDWDNWAARGLVDRIAQMLYTDNYRALYEGVRTGRKHAGSEIGVTSCIDCYCGYLHTPEKLRRGAWVSLLAGADEVMIVRDGAIERLGLLAGMQQIRADFDVEATHESVGIAPPEGREQEGYPTTAVGGTRTR